MLATKIIVLALNCPNFIKLRLQKYKKNLNFYIIFSENLTPPPPAPPFHPYLGLYHHLVTSQHPSTTFPHPHARLPMHPFLFPLATSTHSPPFFPPGYPPITSLLSASHAMAADKLKLTTSSGMSHRFSPYPTFHSVNSPSPPNNSYVPANLKSAFETVRPAKHSGSPPLSALSNTPPLVSSPLNFSPNLHLTQSSNNSISEIKNIENMIRCLNGSTASENGVINGEKSSQFGINHDKSEVICKEEN